MFCVPRLEVLRSSTFRLALSYMALFGVSVLILLGFIYWSTAGYMVRQTDATIDAEIAGLAESYRLTGLPGLTSVLSERLARKPSGSSIYLLTDPSYNILLGNLDRWPKTPETADGWLDFHLEGHKSLHRARARSFVLAGGFHLLVGRDLYELQEIQRLIVKTLAWGLAITVVLALVGGTMMSRGMVRRIEAINETCRDIIFGDLSRRMPTHDTGDDFDQLSDNLNNMLDRIESLMKGVRQVSDNIAHDLRTPLARLRNRLESLKDPRADAPLQREGLDQAIAEADGLLSTFSALLRISQIEAGSREAGFEPLELAAILRDVAELYEPLAEEKGQRLFLHLGASEVVRGDRDLLFQAFANLLDNAIKYAPAGGLIGLSLESVAGSARVTVADNGPGVPAAAREQVFQRFFRLEESRTTPGNGLGLSLVAAVVALHRARVELADNTPGLRVALTFPPGGSL